jgi:two-component system, LytTR family, response regulator
MGPSGPLRVVLVDDEEPAREVLRRWLSEWPRLEIVGEAGDGASALALIAAEQPDLVFLDVQMPGLTGLDVAAQLHAGRPPSVVFVTAFEQYAIRAFEVSACDYLLKPFDQARLRLTVERVLAQRTRMPGEVLEALRAALVGRTAAPASQVVVKVDGRHLFLRAEEIEWIEAVGKESRLHLDSGELVVREALSSLEERLDAAWFVRVHRSAIVNRARIREVQPWFKGDYVLLMRRGARIVSGRTYRAAVQQLLPR